MMFLGLLTGERAVKRQVFSRKAKWRRVAQLCGKTRSPALRAQVFRSGRSSRDGWGAAECRSPDAGPSTRLISQCHPAFPEMRRPKTPSAVIVNEAFAQRYFLNERVIGKQYGRVTSNGIVPPGDSWPGWERQGQPCSRVSGSVCLCAS